MFGAKDEIRIVRESDYSSDSHAVKRTRSKDIEQKQILTSINGHNSVTNKQKMTGYNPNLDLVNINAFIKFGEILSIFS